MTFSRRNTDHHRTSRKIGFATKPTMVNEETLVGLFNITPGALSVAQENYQASKPAIRSLDVTTEILNLVKNTAFKQRIQQQLAPATVQSRTSKMIVLADLRR